jgi:ATP synthase protein I
MRTTPRGGLAGNALWRLKTGYLKLDIAQHFQFVTQKFRFLDSPKSSQYGPRGLEGAGPSRWRDIAGVESMSDARGDREPDKQPIGEAALSARLRRLGERLGDAEGRARGNSGDRAAANASGYARGFRLSTELVAGVLVGAGLGWLIDRWLGISPWGLIVFLLLGFAAGVLNVMRAAGLASGGVPDSTRRDER